MTRRANVCRGRCGAGFGTNRTCHDAAGDVVSEVQTTCREALSMKRFALQTVHPERRFEADFWSTSSRGDIGSKALRSGHLMA